MFTIKAIFINFLFFLFILHSFCELNLCENKSDGFYTNSTCQTFYLCRNQLINQTFQCTNSSQPIFSSYRQRCVAKNLLYNECHLTNIIENLDNCAWFSIQLSTKPNATLPYSCLYPNLFDIKTKECKHYSQVECHQRFEPKDVCKNNS